MEKEQLIQEIEKNIDNYMGSFLDAERVKDLLHDTGFYNAPCSGGNHLAKAGGLAEHSLNVFHIMMDMKNQIPNMFWQIDKEDILICAVFHDLGKTGDYGKQNYIENILKSGKQSTAKPYTTNKELLYIPHEVRSVKLLSRAIELKEEVEWAILMHNGLYGDFRYTIQGKETPLYLLLHFADMWASRVLEEEL